jgi:hypothetical protein
MILIIVTNALAVIQFGIFAYTVYSAISIRSALSIRLYRNQALGLGLVALAWILLFFDFSAFLSNGRYGLFSAGAGLVMMMLFYWVDASVLAARRYDPLLRDSLHWRKLRVIFWALIICSTVIAASFASYYQVTTGVEPKFMYTLGFGFGIGFLPAYIVVIAGIVALPISAYRTKDRFLRRSLEWFGAFVIILPIVGATSIPIETFACLIIAGYCLYRSARSLVPHGIAQGA